MNIISVDCGNTGAIASYYNGNRIIHDMPTFKKKAGRKRVAEGKYKGKMIDKLKTEYDIPEVVNIITSLNHGDFAAIMPLVAVVESIHAHPGQGVTSMFAMGQGYGIIRGIIAALDIPIYLVSPQKWKGHFGLLKQDKDAARIKAIELFPELADQLNLKKHHGRADALLIGEWYRLAKLS